ncbi:glycosyltransferase family 4 protein [Seonamhaeicola sediminis]|uniref:Glycosyltransferase family 4 protein n=1 Tax=Seonamhaeicola sediminis TaxID=2528206 RepID=A0A562YH86_9FLAO|nr:glycosyltransferase family 4 protein [Seonamhaeicola sediminis]TWO34383.1 glycosyltransferase family 4 protein [Seonamhaeicola sediminis]
MKTLKIAFVVGVFPAISETFIVNQIGTLKEKGCNVKILCTREVNGNPVANRLISKYKLLESTTKFTANELLNKNKGFLNKIMILLKSLGAKGFLPLLKSFKYLTWANIDRVNKQFFKVYFKYYFNINRFDVVHVHFADNAVHLLEQLKRFDGKIVVTFHGYDAHNYPSSYFKGLQNLKHIYYTVNTEYTRQKVLSLGFSKEKIHVLPVGLNTIFFKPESIRVLTSPFIVLFVGRFIELKAPILAIKIIERVINKIGNNIVLYMVGDGEEYEVCKDYIEQNDLINQIFLLGSKSQEEVKNLMNEAHLFLFPGIIDSKGCCEGQGLVIQEAQAMELPVLISDVGGMKEGMIEEKTGYAIKTGNLEAFVERIMFLINNSDKRKEMGARGREFVLKNYDSTIISHKFFKCIY